MLPMAPSLESPRWGIVWVRQHWRTRWRERFWQAKYGKILRKMRIIGQYTWALCYSSASMTCKTPQRISPCEFRCQSDSFDALSEGQCQCSLCGPFRSTVSQIHSQHFAEAWGSWCCYKYAKRLLRLFCMTFFATMRFCIFAYQARSGEYASKHPRTLIQFDTVWHSGVARHKMSFWYQHPHFLYAFASRWLWQRNACGCSHRASTTSDIQRCAMRKSMLTQLIALLGYPFGLLHATAKRSHHCYVCASIWRRKPPFPKPSHF